MEAFHCPSGEFRGQSWVTAVTPKLEGLMKGTRQGQNKPRNCSMMCKVGSPSPVHGGCEVKGLLALRQKENPA